MDVVWRMYPLHPETPEQGRRLEELFKVSPMQVRSMVTGLQQKANELGLGFGARSHTYNSRRAQELGLWAADKGYGEAYDLAVFKAYFVDGINIAKVEELLTIVESVGLDAEEAEGVMLKKRYSKALDDEWARAGSLRIKAIPTFCIGGDNLVGAQTYAVLQDLLEKHGVRRRDGLRPLPDLSTV